MIVSNIHEAKEWFEVLQTSNHSQTAVMVLTKGGQSSEAMNVHRHSDQVLLLIEGQLVAKLMEKSAPWSKAIAASSLLEPLTVLSTAVEGAP
jgi:mannose-6-phosphate isomerase-like protein (cupin superfamily)